MRARGGGEGEVLSAGMCCSCLWSDLASVARARASVWVRARVRARVRVRVRVRVRARPRVAAVPRGAACTGQPAGSRGRPPHSATLLGRGVGYPRRSTAPLVRVRGSLG